MQLILRIAAVLALCWLVIVLFSEGSQELNSETPDHMRMLLVFGTAVVLGLAGGVFVALYVLPTIGEKFGGLFFNPDEEIEKDVHAEAIVLIAKGDYQGAVEAYRAVYEEDPADTLALSEIVKLYCDKLGDPEAGARVLEEALENEWTPEAGAFLAERLVDVRWHYQRDAIIARALLIQIAETMPDTKYAANAQHRLREIERVVEEGVRHALEDAPVVVESDEKHRQDARDPEA